MGAALLLDPHSSAKPYPKICIALNRTHSPQATRRLIPTAPNRYDGGSMKPHGTYKLSYRSPAPSPSVLDPLGHGLGRSQRIVDSLRCQILGGGPEQSLRIRQVFSTPREIFRLEIEENDLHYYRTTLLDRDALEELLETDGVRERILDDPRA
jgi:hypothetical protein